MPATDIASARPPGSPGPATTAARFRPGGSPPAVSRNSAADGVTDTGLPTHAGSTAHGTRCSGPVGTSVSGWSAISGEPPRSMPLSRLAVSTNNDCAAISLSREA